MIFGRKERPARPRRGWLEVVVGKSFAFFLRSIFSGALIAGLAIGLLYLRLLDGPIRLPMIADILEAQLNDGSADSRVRLGEVVLALPEGGSSPSIRFLDVQVETVAGEHLLAVPSLAARFHLPDLLAGRLQPVNLTLDGPVLRVLRSADGRLRVGLGNLDVSGSALDTTAVEAEATGNPAAARGADAVARILDGLAGDVAPISELARLEAITVNDASVAYYGPEGVRIGRTLDTDLSIGRDPNGLLVVADIALSGETPRSGVRAGDGGSAGPSTGPNAGEAGARLRLSAYRRAGTGTTRLRGSFRDFQPKAIAQEADDLAWLEAIDARLNGTIQATVGEAGALSEISGALIATGGRLMVEGAQPQAFDRLALRFQVDPERERLEIERLSIVARAMQAEMDGLVDLRRAADGAPMGVAAQLGVVSMGLDLPEIFAEQLSFNGGQILGEVDFDTFRFDVAEARLNRDDLAFDLSGSAWPEEGGWRTDLRASGRQVAIADLAAHWPLAAAENARTWVVENLVSGTIDDLVAHFRLGRGEPMVSLDFSYADLVSWYLGEMTPITEAFGRAHLTLHDFTLQMDAGQVVPVEGEVLRLDGSSIRISDLWGEVTLADISLRVSGPTRSVLSLIDEQPLGLVAKLGLDPRSVGGEATVEAELAFPLIQELALEEIEVDTQATLVAMALPVELERGGSVDVRARQMRLTASVTEMTLEGDATIDGVPASVRWREDYGATPSQRNVRLSAALTPELVARLGAEVPVFEAGRMPIDVRLSQSGTASPSFTLSADLEDAALTPTGFDWAKPRGLPGTLSISGTLGDLMEIEGLELDTNGLALSGRVTLDEEGALREASISSLRLRNRLDLNLVARRGRDGGLQITAAGERFDTAVFEDRGDEDAAITGEPLLIDFNLEQVLVGPKIQLSPVGGTYRRFANGDVTVEANGQVARRGPFTLDYSNPVGAPGGLVLKSTDAGSFLAAAEFFEGGEGGTLTLEATIAPDDVTDLSGVAELNDLVVRNALTFQSILDEGGASDALKETQGGGLRFRRVHVPFSYGDGILTLGESVATSPALALKLDGTVNEAQGTLDLAGVISPAYAVTGALNNVPVLGRILSGGEGEGIFAMTFRVSGRLQDPDISVNPLSILTPGILRSVFTRRGQEPSGRFLEGLQQDR